MHPLTQKLTSSNSFSGPSLNLHHDIVLSASHINWYLCYVHRFLSVFNLLTRHLFSPYTCVCFLPQSRDMQVWQTGKLLSPVCMTVIMKVAVPALSQNDDVVHSNNSCGDGLKARIILSRTSVLEKERMETSFHADVVLSASFHACNGVANMGWWAIHSQTSGVFTF